MKNFLLLFASILSLPVVAQYEIDQDDFAVVGDTIVYAVDSAFSDDLLNLTITGDSVEWDFSELIEATTDTLVFKNAADVPGGNFFGNATFGYQQAVISTFMKINSSGARVLGLSTALSAFIDTSLIDTSVFGGNIPSSARFKYDNGGLFYLDFPAEYQDSDGGVAEGTFTFYYGDSIMGFYADSIRIKEDVTYDSEIDGYGIIKLPVGEYYGIRQNVWYSRSYSIGVGPIPFLGYLYVLPNIFRITEHNYRFFGEYEDFPLVEINTDSVGTFKVSRFQTQPPGSQVGYSEKLNVRYQIRTFDREYAVQFSQPMASVMVYDAKGELLEQPVLEGQRCRIQKTNGLQVVVATTVSGEVAVIKLAGQ